MSFNIFPTGNTSFIGSKPMLIEPKLLKYYNNKFKRHEQKIKEELLLKNEIELIKSEPIYQKILRNLWEFIKENYGCFILISLILILLYVRYIEVNRKKEKVKDLMEKINREKEIKQFIELQNINKELEEYKKNLNNNIFKDYE